MNKKEYNPEQESVNEIITDYEKYQEEKEFEKDSKSNEEIMKEKANEIINDLNDINYKQAKRNKKKTIIFLIAIIIEIIIIVLIIKTRKSSEEYKMTLVCTNNESELYEDYSMKMVNTYYFDNNDKVAKTENKILYAYNNREAYNKHVLEKDVTDFKGYKKQSAKDDENLVYKTVIIYTYKDLKNNKKVTVDKDLFTFKLPGEKEKTTIMVQNYNDVVETNEIMGFTCK